MEGIVFDTAVFESTIAFLCGVAILAIAVAMILIGSVYDKEAGGRRIYWAEWPLPESEPKTPLEEEEKKPRRAA